MDDRDKILRRIASERRETQTQLKSAYRRKTKLDDKIQRLIDRLTALSEEENELDNEA